MNNIFFKQQGFGKDKDILQFKDVLKDSTKLKEIHIDVFSSNPFDNIDLPLLLLRTNGRGVSIINNGKSIIVADEKEHTYIMNILIDDIVDVYYRLNFENCFDFVLNYQNKLYYRITIFK